MQAYLPRDTSPLTWKQHLRATPTRGLVGVKSWGAYRSQDGLLVTVFWVESSPPFRPNPPVGRERRAPRSRLRSRLLPVAGSRYGTAPYTILSSVAFDFTYSDPLGSPLWGDDGGRNPALEEGLLGGGAARYEDMTMQHGPVLAGYMQDAEGTVRVRNANREVRTVNVRESRADWASIVEGVVGEAIRLGGMPYEEARTLINQRMAAYYQALSTRGPLDLD